MKVSVIPSNYIINVTKEVNSQIESDFLLRAVKVKNNLEESVRLINISFTAIVDGRPVKKIVYSEEMIKNNASELKKSLEKIQNIGSLLILGTTNFWEYEILSETSKLEPNQETGILLEHFKILDKEAVDKCILEIFYKNMNDKENKITNEILVQKYHNNYEYILPVKGSWVVTNNYNDIYSHRRTLSQEFALDFIQMNSDFVLTTNGNTSNKNYSCYGEEVYAIADGEVVDCFADFPENPPGFGSRLDKEKWSELEYKHGFVTSMLGNYITIKHGRNEYSLYAHLIPRSLKVTTRDKVHQGDIIGEIGNSGNSDAPHLHFQLMSGSDFLTARGLPCTFTNIKDMVGEDISFLDENNKIIYTV
ncbi:M23 family metallopeptidase [Natranaerobius thermophilus]|uniref:Peptidase M23 n=1 Tax=Natranaerobius thermophilus (strain ATCC BAA-1301 / DSM 18059 / JW/NM-WN-LF) TaxID=457570 RepID=B2A414_NATTJ|nr:M23 family metallopeptidase [Natranaerobius thermophilus]ACB85116.1 Peptidase M23 [Natranaerobius thermophilus JW/NM-WN-LF]